MGKNKIIIIGGFGRSGTGAIHQLLRKHDNIYALPNYEFRLLTDPDGLINLKNLVTNNWNIFQSDFAIRRFIRLVNNLGNYWSGPYLFSSHSKEMKTAYYNALSEFLYDLQVNKYKGLWAGRSNFLNKIIMRFTNHNKNFINKHIYYCPNLTEKDFYSFSNKFIKNMHNDVLVENGKNIILLNEPNATQNILEVSKLTDSRHFIIIYRDPRDAFASFITKDWSPHSIDDAANFLKLVYERWFSQRELIKDEFIIEVKLEDLVNDFSNTIEKIEKFLKLKISRKLVSISNYDPGKTHIGRWKSDFNEFEKEKINKSFHEILIKTGYRS